MLLPQKSEFVFEFDCDVAYHKYLALARTRLESESGATLLLPDAKSGSTKIKLKCNDKSRVAALKVGCDALIDERILAADAKELNFSHFICIVVQSDSVRDQHAQFESSLRRRYAASAADQQKQLPFNVVPLTKLHLTLAMLRLPTETLLLRARNAIRAAVAALSVEALDERAVVCRFEGLHVFQRMRGGVSMSFLFVAQRTSERRQHESHFEFARASSIRRFTAQISFLFVFFWCECSILGDANVRMDKFAS